VLCVYGAGSGVVFALMDHGTRLQDIFGAGTRHDRKVSIDDVGALSFFMIVPGKQRKSKEIL
jgi:hypothetical protein